MQNLDVGAGTLDSVAVHLRRVHDDGLTRLARAIVDDLAEGCGAPELATALADTLPQLVDLLGAEAASIGERLSVAAGAYRRADWIAAIAAGGKA
jgi:hypothetical protein